MKKYFVTYELRHRFSICYVLVLFMCQVACMDQRQQELRYVDMGDLSETIDINVSDIVSDIEYVKLETTDNCLIGDNSKIFADDQYIFTVAKQQIYLFDRKDGRFIRSVSKAGDAPGEYSRVIRMLPTQEKEQAISAYTNKGLVKYSYQGEVVSQAIKPQDVFFSEITEIGSNKYMGYVFNKEDKLILFDSLGMITKRFPNFLATPSDVMLFPNCGFYEYDHTIHLHESLNDTIFAFRPDSLYPKYKLNWGKHRIALAQMGEGPAQEFCYLQYIYESDRHLFVLYKYDSKDRLTVYDKELGLSLHNNEGYRLVNDMDDFAPITLSQVTDHGFVGYIAAEDFVSWKQQHEEDVKNNPKCKPLLDTKEMDNPIVVIGSPK